MARRRSVAMAAVVLVAGLVVGVTDAAVRRVPGAAAASCTRPTPSAATFGAVLDGLRGPVWTAADLTGSVRLTDGRTLWLYGDTITSGLAGAGAASSTFTARNSAIVQDRGCLSPLLRGSGPTASSWIPEVGGQWNWPGDGYARGTTVWVYATRLAPAGTGPFAFQAQAVDLVEVDQATMTIRAVHRNRYSASPILLGSSVITDGTWTYLYGRDELGTKRNTYVARVAAANPLGATGYWTGATWSTNPALARPIFTTEVIGGPAFTDLGSAYGDKRFVAVVKDGEFLAGHVEVYHAPGPAGPWWKASSVPAPGLPTDASTFTYMTTVHGIDAVTGGLHVTWNVNSFDGASVRRDVHAYSEVHRAVSVNLRVPAGAPPVPAASPVGAAGGLTPIGPARVLDTRIGLGGIARLRPGVPVPVRLAGRAGVPAGASGVVATFTVVNPAAAGYVTVWPCDRAQPVASSINFQGGDVVPNTLTAALASDGSSCVVSTQATDLLVDVAASLAPGGAGFHTVSPARLLDTRGGGRVAAGAVVAVPVTGHAGVPAGAVAVAVNVTAAGPTGWGFVTAWPCDRPMPVASILNVVPGKDRADNAVVPLSSSGQLCLSPSVPTHLIVDVGGWYGGPGASLQPVVPTRRLDTRLGQGGYGRLGAGQSITLPVAGRDGIPANAIAVRVNLTAVGPAASTFVTAYPCQRWPPNISNLNTEPASTAWANGAIVPLGPGGMLCLTSFASADLLVDVEGYLA